MTRNPCLILTATRHRLTFVLTLTLEDLSRASILLTTLTKFAQSRAFGKLVVVVPNEQLSIFKVMLFSLYFPRFPIEVVGEEALFDKFDAAWNKVSGSELQSEGQSLT